MNKNINTTVKEDVLEIDKISKQINDVQGMEDYIKNEYKKRKMACVCIDDNITKNTILTFFNKHQINKDDYFVENNCINLRIEPRRIKNEKNSNATI